MAASLTLLLLMRLLSSNGVAQRPPLEEADILIKDGHVIDGTGGPWMRADVAIKGDRIVYVGRAGKGQTHDRRHRESRDPGFFDMHAHSDFGLSLTAAHSARSRRA